MMQNHKIKSEPRSVQLVINIEPSVVVLLQSILKTENMSMSAYGRGLILWDLVEKNLITREDIMRICVMDRANPNGNSNGVYVDKRQERLPIDV